MGPVREEGEGNSLFHNFNEALCERAAVRAAMPIPAITPSKPMIRFGLIGSFSMGRARAKTLGRGEALIIDYVAERLRVLAPAAANSGASR
jgi:hypothetical protein